VAFALRDRVHGDKEDLVELRRVDPEEVGFADVAQPLISGMTAGTKADCAVPWTRRLALNAMEAGAVLKDEIDARMRREEREIDALASHS